YWTLHEALDLSQAQLCATISLGLQPFPSNHQARELVSNIPSTPTHNADGTLSALVQELQPLPHAGALLRLWLPLAYDAGGGFGRYFLVRCTEDSPEARANEWSIYTRRVLFCAG